MVNYKDKITSLEHIRENLKNDLTVMHVVKNELKKELASANEEINLLKGKVSKLEYLSIEADRTVKEALAKAHAMESVFNDLTNEKLAWKAKLESLTSQIAETKRLSKSVAIQFHPLTEAIAVQTEFLVPPINLRTVLGNNLSKLGQRNYPSTYIVGCVSQPPLLPDNHEINSNTDRKGLDFSSSNHGRLSLLPSAEEGVENEEEGGEEEGDSLVSSLRGTQDATSYGGETQGVSLINDIINDMSDTIKKPTELEIDYGLSSRYSRENFERDRDMFSSSRANDNLSVESSVNPHMATHLGPRARSKSAYHSPANRNHSAPTQKQIDVVDNGIYTKIQMQSLQARQQKVQSGSIASQNSRPSTVNNNTKRLKTAPPIVLMSASGGISSNSSMTSLVTKDASTVIVSSSSIHTSSSQQPNTYTHGSSSSVTNCVPLKKQVANDLEHEFGIPVASKKPSSAGFLPLSIPTQRIYSNISGSNPTTPIFKSTSTSDFSLHSARGGGNIPITSTSTSATTSSSSSLSAFFSHSGDNDPYLTMDTKYIGIGNSMRTYGEQAMVGGIRATSASRGIISAKSHQANGIRKSQHVDFSYG
mmetsp:Transcript_20725/g.28533  ORF Transcript_20725/g.28533 Transcript_20725/m.28533 type:complete len:590 (-) Transcript_20725:437-2206(-)